MTNIPLTAAEAETLLAALAVSSRDDESVTEARLRDGLYARLGHYRLAAALHEALDGYQPFDEAPYIREDGFLDPTPRYDEARFDHSEDAERRLDLVRAILRKESA